MKKIISILVAALLLSCDELERDFTKFIGIAFSFNEKVTTIEVDENIVSFKLEGILNEDNYHPHGNTQDPPPEFLKSM